MVEQKEIDNQKMEDVKNEKPVTEVKDTEDKAPVVDTGSSKKETKDKESGNEEKSAASDKDVKDTKKKSEKKSTGPKRTEVVVNGRDLRISTKHAVAVCNFIKNKNIEDAIADLEEVSKMRAAVPMRGEIPHRKGKMMSGRYPLNAVKEFSMLLKSLKANAINHELELEKVKLTCMANVASRPMKRFGQGKHKRSHVQIKLVPMGGNKK